MSRSVPLSCAKLCCYNTQVCWAVVRSSAPARHAPAIGSKLLPVIRRRRRGRTNIEQQSPNLKCNPTCFLWGGIISTIEVIDRHHCSSRFRKREFVSGGRRRESSPFVKASPAQLDPSQPPLILADFSAALVFPICQSWKFHFPNAHWSIGLFQSSKFTDEIRRKVHEYEIL